RVVLERDHSGVATPDVVSPGASSADGACRACSAAAGGTASCASSLRLSSLARACSASAFLRAISSSITFIHSLLIGGLGSVGRRIDDGIDGCRGLRMIARARQFEDALGLHGAGRRLPQFLVQRRDEFAAPDRLQVFLETHVAGLIVVTDYQ